MIFLAVWIVGAVLTHWLGRRMHAWSTGPVESLAAVVWPVALLALSLPIGDDDDGGDDA